MTRRRLGALAAVAGLALAGCAPKSPGSGTAIPLPSPPSFAPSSAPTATHPSEVSASPDDFVPVSGEATGNLGFHDQVSDGWKLVGAAEIDGSGGWVVVRTDHGGGPGRVIGSVYRRNEAHDDVVTVRLTKRVSSGPLWVSLNVDAGRAKRLEFPGPDLPVQFAGADLATRRVLTVR